MAAVPKIREGAGNNGSPLILASGRCPDDTPGTAQSEQSLNNQRSHQLNKARAFFFVQKDQSTLFSQANNSQIGLERFRCVYW